MYRVELTPAAMRQMERLRGSTLVALRGVILGLAGEPRPTGTRKLAGGTDLWRIRLRIDGVPWRVIYQIRDRDRLVIVTRVAHRDEATYRIP
ncbi:MAG: type II toxin-antitoxin system RelE/ParE family toxin [Candidatus Limnocylindrales bacterium]